MSASDPNTNEGHAGRMPANHGLRLAASACLLLMTWSAGCKQIVRASLEPDEAFDAMPVPAAPDYSQASAWAARPESKDGADTPPPGENDGQASAEFDVFFIHPTTYFSDASWNAPLDDVKANDGVEGKVLPNQAAVFNATARVFAPRYRQATLGAFTSDALVERQKALNLAYTDVVAAFEHYLAHDNHGRPFFIASHSQGSQHATRLLHDFVSGKPLQKQMVAAYVIGTPVSVRALNTTWAGIPICAIPDATGCVVTYNSIKPGADSSRFFGKSYTWLPQQGFVLNTGAELVCVNPISFRDDGKDAPPAAHRGAWRFSGKSAAPDTMFVSAQCVDGLLEVRAANDDYDMLLGRIGDYHLVDYSLFFMDLRHNVAVRAQAWKKANID
jgi:hypothetical protein